MIQRVLHARHFLACILAAATGITLYFRAPFPDANLFLHVMATRSAAAFLFFKYSYTLFLYTTPYIGFSILLSGVYIFALKATRTIRAGRLPLYSDPRGVFRPSMPLPQSRASPGSRVASCRVAWTCPIARLKPTSVIP